MKDRISNVYEIPAQKYNELLAKALKEVSEIKMPEWAIYVKTSNINEDILIKLLLR